MWTIHAVYCEHPKVPAKLELCRVFQYVNSDANLSATVIIYNILPTLDSSSTSFSNIDSLYNISFQHPLCEVEDTWNWNCRLDLRHIMYMSSRSEEGKAPHDSLGGCPNGGYYEMSATSIPVMLVLADKHHCAYASCQVGEPLSLRFWTGMPFWLRISPADHACCVASVQPNQAWKGWKQSPARWQGSGRRRARLRWCALAK